MPFGYARWYVIYLVPLWMAGISQTLILWLFT
jgi:hypothetical protein